MKLFNKKKQVNNKLNPETDKINTWDKIKLFLDEEIVDLIIIKYNNNYSVAIDKTYRYKNPSNSTDEIAQYIFLSLDGDVKILDVDSCKYVHLDLNKMNELFIYKKLDAIFQAHKLKVLRKKILSEINELKNELKKINEKYNSFKKIYNFNI